jgi:hypothetical protein
VGDRICVQLVLSSIGGLKGRTIKDRTIKNDPYLDFWHGRIRRAPYCTPDDNHLGAATVLLASASPLFLTNRQPV